MAMTNAQRQAKWRKRRSAIEQALRAAGWTPWLGGPCPVDPNSYPIVLTADGGTDCERASDQQWVWDDRWPASNVIAWRRP